MSHQKKVERELGQIHNPDSTDHHTPGSETPTILPQGTSTKNVKTHSSIFLIPELQEQKLRKAHLEADRSHSSSKNQSEPVGGKYQKPYR
jgi:hypothetical protein